MSKGYELVVIGSGAAAFAAALKASELGAKVALVEHDVVGGTCVNRGCIPSKNLIQAARLLHYSRTPVFPGLKLSGEMDSTALMAQKDELVEELRREKYVDIAQRDPNIELIEGKARFIGPQGLLVGSQRVKAKRFVIATGARPHVPPIPGLNEVPYLTSRIAFELRELPERIVIVGGGYIACELGQLFSRLGAQVAILEQGPRLLADFEPVISRALVERFRAEGIRVELAAEVVEVRGGEGEIRIFFRREGKTVPVEGTHLLVSTGRVPNTEDLGLAEIGVKTDSQGFIRVDEGMRTSVPHVFAAGDVTGPPIATPVAAREGAVAAENALTDAGRRMDYRVIPRAVFTDPEIGVVSLTEGEAEARGIRCSCRVLDLRFVPKARAIREAEGLVKMVAEAGGGRILGVHLFMPQAAEIIHEAALAVRLGLTVADLADAIHVYPTLSEVLRLVAQSFTRDVTRLSCCAE